MSKLTVTKATTKRRLMALCVLGYLLVSHAFADDKPALLKPLLSCQPTFFAEIAKHRDTLGKLAPIVGNADHAHFQVNPADNNVLFKQPIEENGLTIIGYNQSEPQIGPGKYYFWGLLVKNTFAEIAEATPSVHWRKVGANHWMGFEQINRTPQASLVWQDNPNAVFESEPPQGSAEKVMGLYQMKYVPGTYYVHCTIQGNIPDALLYQERPDIAGDRCES